MLENLKWFYGTATFKMPLKGGFTESHNVIKCEFFGENWTRNDSDTVLLIRFLHSFLWCKREKKIKNMQKQQGCVAVWWRVGGVMRYQWGRITGKWLMDCVVNVKSDSTD